MKRIITGLILLFIGASCVWFGGIFLYLFLAISGVFGFIELQKMTGNQSRLYLILNGLLYCILLASTSYFSQIDQFHSFFTIPIILMYCITLFEFFNKKISFSPLINSIKNFLYIYLGFSSLLLLRFEQNGLAYTITILLVIWACDICAYYGGKTFGKHPLSKISPKKTIEGTVIGTVGSVFIFFIIIFYFSLPLYYLFFALVIAVFSQIGDLYESLIKRTYDVKDSSNILPGHGGILDRADSTLYVFPLMLLLVKYLIL